MTLAAGGYASFTGADNLPPAADSVLFPFHGVAADSVQVPPAPAVIFETEEVSTYESSGDVLLLPGDGSESVSDTLSETTGSESSEEPGANQVPGVSASIPASWLNHSNIADWEQY